MPSRCRHGRSKTTGSAGPGTAWPTGCAATTSPPPSTATGSRGRRAASPSASGSAAGQQFDRTVALAYLDEFHERAALHAPGVVPAAWARV